MRFHPGEIILRRHFQHQALDRVVCCRVIEHDERGLLLWAGVGSTVWDLNTVDDRGPRDMPLPEWITAPKVPIGHAGRTDVLMWHPAGEAYSIWFFFAPDGTFSNWYGNLEMPAVAWRDVDLGGIDTVDWDLDVWIRPDRSWHWKDEQEFAERLGYGAAYWVADEAAVWAAGHRVVELVEAGVFPFDGTWCDFKPEPDWTVPAALPTGWDRPRAC
jgi:hypothetical protein